MVVKNIAQVFKKWVFVEIVGNEKMVCKKSAAKSTVKVDQDAVLWQCVERRNGEGRRLVQVVRQGLSTMQLAEISIEQMFPLDPLVLETLVCSE